MRRVMPRQDVCMACRLCEVACLVEHSRSRDLMKAYKREKPRAVARIRVEELGPLSFAMSCRHCEEPSCVRACLTGALSKDPETGIVSIDAEKCMGCWTCILFCPHGSIVPDVERGVAAKCDFCPHLETPACIAICPNRALLLAEEKTHA
ncbi:MAG: 4Fe-4S dicluster domain-containing protein [Chloroflexi bacterium]|nr:4Fe-4S dicluster domain-containing protein [Chloroflexota bacterium]